jgi:hypothetical protein
MVVSTLRLMEIQLKIKSYLYYGDYLTDGMKFYESTRRRRGCFDSRSNIKGG